MIITNFATLIQINNKNLVKYQLKLKNTTKRQKQLRIKIIKKKAMTILSFNANFKLMK